MSKPNLANKKECTGCLACVASCKKNALSSSVDEDGQLFGIAEQLEELQKTDAYLFTPKQIELEKKGPVNLFAGGNPSSNVAKDPKNMSLDEQTDLYRKYPSQWQSLFVNNNK